MKLYCPKCDAKLEVGVDIEESVPCPSCGDLLNIPSIRAATCPICGCGFEETDEIRICHDCKTPHHEECWNENRGCSTYGCTSAAHQETHTAETSSFGASYESGMSGMIACPACGAMHPATDLVCGSCGKLLGDNLQGDSAWKRLRESACRNMDAAKASLLPRLARNFRLLGGDIGLMLRLWWQEFSRYVDFQGKTGRMQFASFMGVTCVGFMLFWSAAVVFVLLCLALVLPTLAICVRRLRDTDISPWMILAVPLLPLLLLVPSIKTSDNNHS